jgi:DNA-binding NtrC family response regulator
VKALVVDDDPIVLESCRRILESDGWAVTAAGGVSEALAAMAVREFDLLVLDLKMPERDGLQMMAHLKERSVPVPVIVMSGYATSDTILASLEGGAFAFVSKPFTPDELLASVSFVVGEDHEESTDHRDR